MAQRRLIFRSSSLSSSSIKSSKSKLYLTFRRRRLRRTSLSSPVSAGDSVMLLQRAKQSLFLSLHDLNSKVRDEIIVLYGGILLPLLVHSCIRIRRTVRPCIGSPQHQPRNRKATLQREGRPLLDTTVASCVPNNSQTLSTQKKKKIMAAEPSGSSGSADSYLGSLINLTSKSEIRYEGVLFNINTAEASIGLSNVRSFGTEGRKKDGPQIPPSDKVYEYILFRGSDIKDLQVKASPSIQTTAPMYNDPAIIQLRCSQAATSTNLPTAGAGSLQDLSSHASQLVLPSSTFQGSFPLYQPGGSSGSWSSLLPPPTTNGSGLTTPMYWQGLYGVSDGLQAQHQSLLRPLPGLSTTQSMQQSMQYPAMNASLPAAGSNLLASQLSEFPPPPVLPPLDTGTLNLHSPLLPGQFSAVASGSSTTLVSNMMTPHALPPASFSTSLPLVFPWTAVLEKNTLAPAVPNEPTIFPGSVPYNGASEPKPSLSGISNCFLNEGSTPSLVTPGQLLQPGLTTAPSSQSPQTAQDVEVVQISSSELPVPTLVEAQAPILPLPSPPVCKLSGAPSHIRHNNRGGHERVRPNGTLHPVTRFTEDFDFLTMNEKFNKYEVWDHLGKSNKAQEDGNGSQDEDDAGPSKLEVKPVYVKDDFFDSLSCNALDRGSRNGRTKFSERMKMDAETFGDFTRHRGGRGGRGRGLGRAGYSRGGFYPRSYGHIGRGRGHGTRLPDST